MRLPSRLSYSSVTALAECGLRWLRERREGALYPTWWATVAGSAVHAITEAEDRRLFDGETVVPTWEDAFAAEIESEGRREILASGTVLKKIGTTGGPNKKDKAWWDIYGPIYVQRWLDWRDARLAEGWTFAVTPDGQLGIEVDLDFEIGGGLCKAFIDRLLKDPDGELVTVDLKTGAKPKNGLQLAVYREGLLRIFGDTSGRAFYWMGHTGEALPDADLSPYPSGHVEAWFAAAWADLKAGNFVPCGSLRCPACGGDRLADLTTTTQIGGITLRI